MNRPHPAQTASAHLPLFRIGCPARYGRKLYLGKYPLPPLLPMLSFSAAPLIVIQNDAARDPLLQGGYVHALPQRLGALRGLNFNSVTPPVTVFQNEN